MTSSLKGSRLIRCIGTATAGFLAICGNSRDCSRTGRRPRDKRGTASQPASQPQTTWKQEQKQAAFGVQVTGDDFGAERDPGGNVYQTRFSAVVSN
ncbi:hypothetical protein JOL62DRAFT_570397 [Phyllosticta paracitricarpa]|uniref:Uncharacterized protein n=1 Tax=Phyllosticta paracitricarpa TaxID=2016321 RepID=A0ABR1NCB3_9PEZI